MIKEVTYYQGVCDWPGCDNDPHDQYTAWADPGSVLDDVESAGWRFSKDTDETFYCDQHPTVWASDHEQGQPLPEPPYLLIHDGDTGNSVDDGKVTLITEPEPEKEAEVVDLGLAFRASFAAAKARRGGAQ